MKSILALLLLTVLTAFGQAPRYILNAAGTTNSTITATTLSNFNYSVDMGASTKCDVLIRFYGTTNTSSNVVVTIDQSLDAVHFTNSISLTNQASTTNYVWWQTTVAVTNAARLRFVSVTNCNSGSLTNFDVYFGRKNFPIP